MTEPHSWGTLPTEEHPPPQCVQYTKLLLTEQGRGVIMIMRWGVSTLMCSYLSTDVDPELTLRFLWALILLGGGGGVMLDFGDLI